MVDIQNMKKIECQRFNVMFNFIGGLFDIFCQVFRDLQVVECVFKVIYLLIWLDEILELLINSRFEICYFFL